MWPFPPALHYFTSPYMSIDSALTVFEQIWIFMMWVNFLKIKITRHHSGLFLLPCRYISSTEVTEKGLRSRLVLRKLPLCRTGLDGVAKKSEGWKGGFQGSLPGGSSKGAEARMVKSS